MRNLQCFSWCIRHFFNSTHMNFNKSHIRIFEANEESLTEVDKQCCINWIRNMELINALSSCSVNYFRESPDGSTYTKKFLPSDLISLSSAMKIWTFLEANVGISANRRKPTATSCWFNNGEICCIHNASLIILLALMTSNRFMGWCDEKSTRYIEYFEKKFFA